MKYLLLLFLIASCSQRTAYLSSEVKDDDAKEQYDMKIECMKLCLHKYGTEWIENDSWSPDLCHCKEPDRK